MSHFLFTQLVVSVGGLLSSILGGYLSDNLANPINKDWKRARCWVPALGSLIAIPCWIMFVEAPSPELALTFLFFEYIFAECWFGPTLAALFAVVPAELRGTAQGLFSMLTAIGRWLTSK